ncbi:MAG: vitamin B12 dependent-methionine synthase activation domain-containing protein [Christensenellales bacterium]|jgi:hypothetical protein
MANTVWERLPFSLQAEKLLKFLKLEDDPDMEEEFREVFEKCLAIANPKMLWRTEPVKTIDDYTTLVGEYKIHSRILRVNFENVSSCIPYVATCGRELYEYSLSEGDPLTRYWIDAISEEILRKALVGAMERIRALLSDKNLYAMNPGSLSDFSIINQRQLFAMLGTVREDIGVELTESCLMLPAKSVSGLLFHSNEHYVNCALCPREGCTNRRAKFDERLFAQKYAPENISARKEES